MIEKYLTTEQVSNILQVHPFTILKFIREGRLKGIKLGRVYRIKESDVHEFLTSAAISPKKSDKQDPKEHIVEESAKSKVFEIPVVEDKNGGEHFYII